MVWVAVRDGIRRHEARIKVRHAIHEIKEHWGLPPTFGFRFYPDCTLADPVTDQELGFIEQ